MKLKNNLYKIMLCALPVLGMGTGCSDFLEEVNPNEMSTESFWKTVDDLDAGLIAVYNAFKNQNLLAIPDEYNRSDMTWPGWGRPNTSNQYYLQEFNESSSTPNNKWDALYKGIFRANQVIVASEELIPTLKDESSQERASTILAQARFFRGLFYFYLTTGFNEGNVPIFDFVPQNEEEFYQPVKPKEEVMAFYLADLEYAHEHLPPSYSRDIDQGRVTAGAAAAVLGKSHLYNENYTQAKVYFEDVMENPAYGYALTENIGDNFTTTNELNSESILEINYSLAYKSEISAWAEEQVSNNLNFTVSPVGGWRSLYPSCWLIMAYKEDPVDINDPRNYVVDEDGSTRLRKYSLRTSYSIALVDDTDLEYYGTSTAEATAFNNKETGYFRKYSNWEIVEDEKDIVPNLRSGVNVRVIRLADVYLMYAEALLMGDGNVEEAMTYINRVRHRSALQLLGMDGTGEYPAAAHDNQTYDVQSLMDHLMYVERPLELSLEGNAIRTIDLRRWGITKDRFEELSQRKYYTDNFEFVNSNGQSVTRWASVLTTEEMESDVLIDYQQAASNYIASEHAYWPIPNSEIVANPQIGGEE
ncbi:RagB/SusD family nutrient uptake outer membrane protein [Echinicola rosea]|uniref:Membrane protein n=1 Tax=Echinicola rosea TaxID=1807691 RepID=A0ABQ1V2X5_9BACT|nr:RagB/SusD family nutrient uptake outer membrane protein [Echinicola rosea]GGF36398.1 membrane protein [Echinicola rosea]